MRGLGYAFCLTVVALSACQTHLVASSNCDAGDATAQVRDPPSDAGVSATPAVTYALDSILLGDVARGSPLLMTGNLAWMGLGFDLDGLVTDRSSIDVCTSRPGAASTVHDDGWECGKRGLDNSFGANVLPVFQASDDDPTPSNTFTNLMRQGAFTLQIEVVGLDLAATNQTSVGLSVQTFAANRFDPLGNTQPDFATNQDWPVRSDLHPVPQQGLPLRTAYINGGTLVARDGDVVLSAVLASGRRLDLRVHHAVVQMDVNGDHGDNGTLAGVLAPEELIATARGYAAGAQRPLCGAAFDGFAETLRGDADILDDGTNAPGRECDAISIGVGFTARRIANPTRTAPPEPVVDRCPDGGTDAATDSPSD